MRESGKSKKIFQIYSVQEIRETAYAHDKLQFWPERRHILNKRGQNYQYRYTASWSVKKVNF